MPKSNDRVKFKKAPGAPRRFKSSYMFFSTVKHKEIRQKLEEEGQKDNKTTDIAKLVAAEWKTLTPEERKPWDDLADEDKARFELERSKYTGPWKIPSRRGKAKKDKNAPKRPMSAFLAYSHTKRAECRAANPHMDNIDVSRELAKEWKTASKEEKQPFIDEEAKLREQYKINIAEWRTKHAEEELAEEEQQAIARLARNSQPRQYQNDLYSNSAERPLVAPTSNLASVAAHLAAQGAVYPSAAAAASSDYYGYGSNHYANQDLLSRASAYAQQEQVALAGAYAREQEQAAMLRAIANTYSNPLNGVYASPRAESDTTPHLSNPSAGAYDSATSQALSAYAAGAAGLRSQYASAPAANSYGNNYYERGSTTNEQGYEQAIADYVAYQQQQQQQQQQDGGGYPPRSFM